MDLASAGGGRGARGPPRGRRGGARPPGRGAPGRYLGGGNANGGKKPQPPLYPGLHPQGSLVGWAIEGLKARHVQVGLVYAPRLNIRGEFLQDAEEAVGERLIVAMSSLQEDRLRAE